MCQADKNYSSLEEAFIHTVYRNFYYKAETLQCPSIPSIILDKVYITYFDNISTDNQKLDFVLNAVKNPKCSGTLLDDLAAFALDQTIHRLTCEIFLSILRHKNTRAETLETFSTIAKIINLSIKYFLDHPNCNNKVLQNLLTVDQTVQNLRLITSHPAFDPSTIKINNDKLLIINNQLYIKV